LHFLRGLAAYIQPYASAPSDEIAGGVRQTEANRGERRIGRLWHGWTSRENAAAYEKLLLGEVLPGIQQMEGSRGAYLMRHDRADEVEFVTLTIFESLDAVRCFAGEDYEVAVVLPEARALLLHFDQRSAHYEIVATPDAAWM
jgi:heme-degrading monooxygenase HmoA